MGVLAPVRPMCSGILIGLNKDIYLVADFCL
jgi:hypothetical protein